MVTPSRRRTLAKYGLTPEDFEVILNYQNGVCYICQRAPKEGKNLHIDHDHKTGMTRGLLCWRCNRGLPLYGDDPERFYRASHYLDFNPVRIALQRVVIGKNENRRRRRKKKAPRS